MRVPRKKVRQRDLFCWIVIVYFVILNIGIVRFLVETPSVKLNKIVGKGIQKLPMLPKHSKTQNKQNVPNCNLMETVHVFMYLNREGNQDINTASNRKTQEVLSIFFSVARLFIWNFKTRRPQVDQSDQNNHATVKVHLLLSSVTFSMQARDWCSTLSETTQKRGVCDLVILENSDLKSVLGFVRREAISTSVKQYKDSCMPGIILMNQIAVETLSTEHKHFTNQQLSVMLYDDFSKSDKTKISCFWYHRISAYSNRSKVLKSSDRNGGVKAEKEEMVSRLENDNMCSAFSIPLHMLLSNNDIT